MAYRIHVDEPGCDCGRCEPAEPVVPMSAGALVSGNLACEWPACATANEGCRWGFPRCFDEPYQNVCACHPGQCVCLQVPGQVERVSHGADHAGA